MNKHTTDSHPKQPEVAIDLVRDWIAITRKKLVKAGYTKASCLPAEEVGYFFFQVMEKQIPQRPRQVHLSKRLVTRPNLGGNVEHVLRKIEEGANLTPHLSKGITDPTRGDYLLYDWGIHHLHLGTPIDQSGFARRSKDLLFVYFTYQDAYALDVRPHRDDSNAQPWADQTLLETLHREWPKLLEPFRVKGATGLAHPISKQDRENLRKANVCSMIEIDGSVFIGPGLGYTVTGSSTNVVRNFSKLKQLLLDM